MYGKMSEKIADWCCNEDKEDYEIVAYGWSVILENIVKTLILIGLAIGFHQFKEGLIILISFCGVRAYAGGIHAKSTVGCTAFMIVVELSCMLLNYYLYPTIYGFLILGVVSNVLVWLYAPNGSESCDFLSVSEKTRKKRRALITVNLLFLVSIVLQIQKLVFVPITIEAISLLLSEIQRRRTNEGKRSME